MAGFRVRIDLEPIPQPRPRFGVTRPKNPRLKPKAIAYTPKDDPVVAFRAEIAKQCRKLTKPLGGPVSVAILFLIRREGRVNVSIPSLAFPASYPSRANPDCDNLTKSVLDALKGIAWDDDAQVCELEVWKYYHPRRVTPCLLLSVEPMVEYDPFSDPRFAGLIPVASSRVFEKFEFVEDSV